jgi:hypothetical protein
VHLARQADTFDVGRRDPALRQDVFDRLLRGAPPVGRLLFGPRGARRRKGRMAGRRRRENAPRRVNDDGARTAGADVEAEDRNDGTP